MSAGLNYRAVPVPQTNVQLGGVVTQQNLEMKRVQNALNSVAGLRMAARTVTSDGSISGNDGGVYADTTAAAVTMTLPFASEFVGQVLILKRIAGANTYTVQVRTGDSITTTTPTSVTSVTVTGAAKVLHAADATTWQQIL